MSMMFRAAEALLSLAAPVSATTLISFDGVADWGSYGGEPPDYYEDGFKVGGQPASWGGPGDVHLDDDYAWSHYISVTTTGLFSALAVDIYGGSQATVTIIEATEFTEEIVTPTEHLNVWFKAFVDDVLVAERGYSSGLDGFRATVTLGPEFRGLDRFEIHAEHRLPPGVYCTDAPCGHFTLDNLVVGPAAIPLPAAGWLLAGGIGALILGHRRGKRG